MPNGQGEPHEWPDWTGLYRLGCTCVELNDINVGVPKPGITGWGGAGVAAWPAHPDPDCPLHSRREARHTLARLYDLATFTCPVCDSTSFNPNDAAERYCGRCHGYTEIEPPPGFRWVRFRLADDVLDFGRILPEKDLVPGFRYTVIAGDDAGEYVFTGADFIEASSALETAWELEAQRLRAAEALAEYQAGGGFWRAFVKIMRCFFAVVWRRAVSRRPAA